jgi:hypothetical protein
MIKKYKQNINLIRNNEGYGNLQMVAQIYDYI